MRLVKPLPSKRPRHPSSPQGPPLTTEALPVHSQDHPSRHQMPSPNDSLSSNADPPEAMRKPGLSSDSEPSTAAAHAAASSLLSLPLFPSQSAVQTLVSSLAAKTSLFSPPRDEVSGSKSSSTPRVEDDIDWKHVHRSVPSDSCTCSESTNISHLCSSTTTVNDSSFGQGSDDSKCSDEKPDKVMDPHVNAITKGLSQATVTDNSFEYALGEDGFSSPPVNKKKRKVPGLAAFGKSSPLFPIDSVNTYANEPDMQQEFDDSPTPNEYADDERDPEGDSIDGSHNRRDDGILASAQRLSASLSDASRRTPRCRSYLDLRRSALPTYHKQSVNAPTADQELVFHPGLPSPSSKLLPWRSHTYRRQLRPVSSSHHHIDQPSLQKIQSPLPERNVPSKMLTLDKFTFHYPAPSAINSRSASLRDTSKLAGPSRNLLPKRQNENLLAGSTGKLRQHVNGKDAAGSKAVIPANSTGIVDTDSANNANSKEAPSSNSTKQNSKKKNGKKGKSGKAKANANNVHHVDNYVPSRLPASASRDVRGHRSKPHSGKHDVHSREHDELAALPESFQPESDEYLCAICEYRLYYGSESMFSDSIRRRKAILRVRNRARRRAKEGLEGKLYSGKRSQSPVSAESADDEDYQESIDSEYSQGLPKNVPHGISNSESAPPHESCSTAKTKLPSHSHAHAQSIQVEP